MALPDISKLLKARETAGDLETKIRDINGEIYKLRIMVEEEIAKRYEEAGITRDECDHPIVKSGGMGTSYCKCCGEYLS